MWLFNQHSKKYKLSFGYGDLLNSTENLKKYSLEKVCRNIRTTFESQMTVQNKFSLEFHKYLGFFKNRRPLFKSTSCKSGVNLHNLLCHTEEKYALVNGWVNKSNKKFFNFYVLFFEDKKASDQ